VFLRESVAEWFETDDDVPFMMQVFQIRSKYRDMIPAVIHVDGTGRLQTVHQETNPRYYRLIEHFRDLTGIPLHEDNETVVKERIYLDKSDPDLLHNEMTVIDNALTKPWSVHKRYSRAKDEFPVWPEDICPEGNGIVRIGSENYFLSGEGHLMPTRKGQEPPDLRYFKKPAQN